MFHYADRSRGVFWGIVIIIVGILFLMDEFQLLDIGDLWPLIIIAIGLRIVFNAQYFRSNCCRSDVRFGDHSLISDESKVIESNTFGDIKVTIKSKDFQTGQIFTTFGAVKVDLTELNIKSGEQTLRLNTSFGEIKIAVPRDVPYAIHASNTAGDIKLFEEKRSGWRQLLSYQSQDYEGADRKLNIIANTMFGEIKAS